MYGTEEIIALNPGLPINLFSQANKVLEFSGTTTGVVRKLVLLLGCVAM